ncbi:ATP-binding protein [Myxococcus stipitatus]|uniref:ATP-binding protein n=1 Tax=Myxococcus stipitatus TaxID=83455 RepID=UPI003CD01077
MENWGKLLGDNATVAAMFDRLLHHAHVVPFGPRSWPLLPCSPSPHLLGGNLNDSRPFASISQ